MNKSTRDWRPGLVVAAFVILTSIMASPLSRAGAQTTTSAPTSTSSSATSSSTSTSSTSSSTSSSTTSTTKPSTTTTTTPAQGCHSTFDGGTRHPGDTVKGTLALNNGCKFSGNVDVTLNDATLSKSPAADGSVSVTVKVNSVTSGILDDPKDVTLHQGINTVVVSGQGQTASGTPVGTVTIDASFSVQPAAGTTTTTANNPAVVPTATQTTSGSTSGNGLATTGANLVALFAMALVVIVLGTHAVASRWTAPVEVGFVGRSTAIVSLPSLRLDAVAHIGWMLEAAALTAVSYILGPPPGRHAKKGGPQGLVPMVRDWMYRDR